MDLQILLDSGFDLVGFRLRVLLQNQAVVIGKPHKPDLLAGAQVRKASRFLLQGLEFLPETLAILPRPCLLTRGLAALPLSFPQAAQFRDPMLKAVTVFGDSGFA